MDIIAAMGCFFDNNQNRGTLLMILNIKSAPLIFAPRLVPIRGLGIVDTHGLTSRRKEVVWWFESLTYYSGVNLPIAASVTLFLLGQ